VAEGTQKRVELAPDDAVRMRRLTEEVSGRLHEMALIFGRTVGVPIGPDVVPRFAPRQRTKEIDLPPVDSDIEIIMLPDGTSCCYDYREQVCACPC
jgi:hypothetical protein